VSSDYISDQMRSDLRICTEEAFDRYFLYGNYVDDVQNSLVMNVVRNIARPEKYREILKPYFYSSKLRIILDYVRYNSEFIKSNVGNLSDIVALILDMSDYLKDDIATSFTSPIRFYATNAIEDLLRDTEPEVRANIIASAEHKSNAIAGFITTVAILQEEKKKDTKKGEFIPEHRLTELLGVAQERGLKWLGSNESLDHPQFRSLINIVKNLTDQNEFESTLLVLLGKNIQNYKKLLRNYITDRGPIEYGKVAGKQKLEFDFVDLDNIFDLGKLQKKYSDVAIPFEVGESEVYRVAWDLYNGGIGNYLYEKRLNNDNQKGD